MSTTAELDRLDAHREARIRNAASSRGPASFFWGDMVTAPGQTVTGAPGRWSPLPAGEAGVRVDATAADGIRIGGALVDGTAILHYDEADGPTVASFPDGAEGIVFSYDRSKFALQVWNPHSEWANRFAGITAYPCDDAWRIEGRIETVAPGRTVAIPHHRDPRPIDTPVTAEVVFEVDGAEYRLAATRGARPDSLLVLFADATNGVETYSAGRSLELDSAGPGRVILDFNYAALLPCSFSLAWNCPIPPVENHLPIAVRAGERNAVDAQGEPLL
ncbi:DUF1684 domain-containing protein [Gryllotalpicola sp.]|uniref:DUF1684 domain-containing protein n=1 Tax=Gryllotalpicola sp. TaxID=1932787 RepID=UPI00260C2A7C|nr:DUF1684 domain-containing protein [Gryllotalpicola sp.]